MGYEGIRSIEQKLKIMESLSQELDLQNKNETIHFSGNEKELVINMK